jgi:hypothetical protein
LEKPCIYNLLRPYGNGGYGLYNPGVTPDNLQKPLHYFSEQIEAISDQGERIPGEIRSYPLLRLLAPKTFYSNQSHSGGRFSASCCTVVS